MQPQSRPTLLGGEPREAGGELCSLPRSRVMRRDLLLAPAERTPVGGRYAGMGGSPSRAAEEWLPTDRGEAAAADCRASTSACRG